MTDAGVQETRAPPFIDGAGGSTSEHCRPQEDEAGDREIHGKWEPEYIPSCRERIEEILRRGKEGLTW